MMAAAPPTLPGSAASATVHPDPDPAAIGLHHLDSWLMVAEKPPGLLCQPGLGPDLQDSLVLRLQSRWPEARLVHRLDRDTSGLILLARDAETHRRLSRAFADRQVQKTYQARVLGSPSARSGTIEAPIQKAGHRPPLYRVDPAGRPSRTDWQRIRSHGFWSEVELRPHTGRSHQLRVHLLSIGHPILGDPLYGEPEARGLCRRLCLHASDLAFRHPWTDQWLEAHAPARFPAVIPERPPAVGQASDQAL